MYVHLLNDSSQNIGGGWTFMRNLEKGLKLYSDVKIAGSIADADICFCSGPTMIKRSTVDKVQDMGKKLVVRLDNVPRNSRNRNTGTSRLKEFAERADGVVWQCFWAKEYLGDFIHAKKENIIYNGVDTDIFKPKGKLAQLNKLEGCKKIYLYSRFNRDETKRWEEAWYKFQMIHRDQEGAGLLIVGNFSPEQIDYNFDFFRGERVHFIPTVHDPEIMASIYRACDYFLATYYNDCFSNTYLEALACGVELFQPNMSGGTPELIDHYKNGKYSLEHMIKEYVDFFKSI